MLILSTIAPVGQIQLFGVAPDLKQHYQKISINILGTWQHRGNVELYFKYRYQANNYPIGKLTEYFKFKDVSSVVLDLEQMQPKKLTHVEFALYQGVTTSILN